MKRVFYFLSVYLVIPTLVFAQVEYEHYILDYATPSVTIINVTATDYNKDIGCGGLGFWGVQVIEHETGKIISGTPSFVSSAVLDVSFTLDIPPGNYEEITFTCSDDGVNLAFQHGSLDNDLYGDQIIFVASEIPVITSDLDDGNIVTVTIDGDEIYTIETTENVIVENSTGEIPSIIEADKDQHQTTTVGEDSVEFVDTSTDSIIEIPKEILQTPQATSTPEIPSESAIEETTTTSSITTDSDINATTTTTF